MKSKLSSSLTFLCKYGNPVFVIVLGSVLIRATISIEPFYSLLLLLVTVLVLFLLYSTVMKVKVVKIDEQNLYVSDYLKQEVVSLENIRDVTEFILFSPRLIKVHFYDKTMFGREIIFIGSTVPFLFFASHPAVTIIEDLKTAKLRQMR